jgi:serine/threonine protein phosphatase PrpC
MTPKHSRQAASTPSSPSAGTARPFASGVQIDVSGLSHPGKVRARNEDHFLVTRIGRYLETVLSSLPSGEVPERAEEAGYALIVADGMGGHAGGELASRMAISGLVKLALEMPDWIFRLDDTSATDASARSKWRFQRLNTMLIEHGHHDPDLLGMGTTLTAARNLGRQLHIVHVGDSRVYLFRDSCLHRLTRDHTYVQLLVDSGELSPDEAARFGARHVLLNALGGCNEDVNVDVDQMALENGDRILLCSDGLTDLVDDDAIGRVLGECPGSAEACRRLIDLALDGGGRDNITAVVARYTFS